MSLVSELGDRDDVALKIVLLENGGHEAAARDALHDGVGHASSPGLGIRLTPEQQATEVATEVFSCFDPQPLGRKSNSLSRSRFVARSQPPTSLVLKRRVVVVPAEVVGDWAAVVEPASWERIDWH